MALPHCLQQGAQRIEVGHMGLQRHEHGFAACAAGQQSVEQQLLPGIEAQQPVTPSVQEGVTAARTA